MKIWVVRLKFMIPMKTSNWSNLLWNCVKISICWFRPLCQLFNLLEAFQLPTIQLRKNLMKWNCTKELQRNQNVIKQCEKEGGKNSRWTQFCFSNLKLICFEPVTQLSFLFFSFFFVFFTGILLFTTSSFLLLSRIQMTLICYDLINLMTEPWLITDLVGRNLGYLWWHNLICCCSWWKLQSNFISVEPQWFAKRFLSCFCYGLKQKLEIWARLENVYGPCFINLTD